MRGDGRVTERSAAAHTSIGIASLLPQHVELPSQYADRHGASATQLQPEKALMLAVLEEAIETWKRYRASNNTKARALAQDAADWISSDDESWLYAYRRVCEALGLEPDNLRRGLKAWQDRHVAEEASPLIRRARIVLARLGTLYVRADRLGRALGIDTWRIQRWRRGHFEDVTLAEVEAMEAYATRLAETRRANATAPEMIARLATLGWPQVRIARRLGVSEQSVSGWVMARTNPRPDLMYALERLLVDEALAPAATPTEAAAC